MLPPRDGAGFDGDAAAAGPPRAARWRRARAPCPRTRRTRGSRTPRARTTWRPRARGRAGARGGGNGSHDGRRPGRARPADGCAALADAFEAHLRRGSRVPPVRRRRTPRPRLWPSGSAPTSARGSRRSPLDAGALAAPAAARDFQNAVAAAGETAPRSRSAPPATGRRRRRVDESFSKGVSKSLSRDVTLESESNEAYSCEANALTRTFEPFRLSPDRAGGVRLSPDASRRCGARRCARRAETWRGVAAVPAPARPTVPRSAPWS